MPKQKFTKRADGRYTCSVYLGKDVHGNRKYKTLYAKTQKELQKKYNEIKLQLDRGIDISAQNETFKKWADRYIRNKEGNVGERYLNCLKYQLKHLDPLNNIPIAKIRPYQIQDILDELANRSSKPLSKKSLTDIRNIANRIFQLAANNRILDFNPINAVEIPKGSGKKKREAINDEQIQWIMDTPHKAQTASMIMLYAGLRRGELLALTWTDIDLMNKTISVNKAVEFAGNQPHIKPMTKTQAGMRLVSIPNVLADYLSQIKPVSLVVCTLNGNTMTECQFRRMWESYMSVLNEKYGDFSADIVSKRKDGKLKSRMSPGGLPMKISTFTPHQLRHTYASMLYKSGIDVVTAKEQLGHSDITTTLNIYTHLDSEYKTRNMDKLNNYLLIDTKQASF
ncbi:MAG: site-specific integrase [Ruminococcus flavefaciens]|nr:site-specific integrase [Ruminococcus flavefaciens]